MIKLDEYEPTEDELLEVRYAAGTVEVPTGITGSADGARALRIRPLCDRPGFSVVSCLGEAYNTCDYVVFETKADVILADYLAKCAQDEANVPCLTDEQIDALAFGPNRSW